VAVTGGGSCRRLLDSGVTQRTLMSKVQRLQGQLAAEGASNGVVLHTQPRSYTKLSNGVQRLRYACRRHALPISLSPRGQPRTHTHMAKVVCSPANSDGVAHRWAHEDAAVQALGSRGGCFIPSHIRTPRLWPPHLWPLIIGSVRDPGGQAPSADAASLRSPPRWYVALVTFSLRMACVSKHHATPS